MPSPTSEQGEGPAKDAAAHRNRVIRALRLTQFEVSDEHSMFESRAKIDVLPSLLIRAHDTIKLWAAELLSRVQEFIGYYLARYVRSKKLRGAKVRPFTRAEFELLYDQIMREGFDAREI